MAGKEYRVALVVDPNFGDRLVPLADKMHVWVCGSSENRRVAQTIRAARPDSSLESGVTVFDFRADETPEQICLGIVNTIDIHHGECSHDPPWTALEVHGAAPTEQIEDALHAYGVERVEKREGGFLACRSWKGAV